MIQRTKDSTALKIFRKYNPTLQGFKFSYTMTVFSGENDDGHITAFWSVVVQKYISLMCLQKEKKKGTPTGNWKLHAIVAQ